MIVGVRGSWQTIIADLALILFMVTAAAMGRDEAEEEIENPLPAQGEALAIYRPEHGAPPIGEWLAEQITDERQQLTIVARYRDKGMQVAADDALALASDAALHGPPPRILLERAERSDLLAVLAFDNPADWHDDCREEGMDDVPQVSGKDSSCD